jgi:hypothetical protein
MVAEITVIALGAEVTDVIKQPKRSRTQKSSWKVYSGSRWMIQGSPEYGK